MSRHNIMKLASNNGQKLLFFPLIYGNHKSCGVICSLTKHLMNPVNALKECRIVNPIESNFIVNRIVLNLQKSLLNRIENLCIVNRIDSLSTQRFTALLYSHWTDRRLCLRLNVHTIHPKLYV